MASPIASAKVFLAQRMTQAAICSGSNAVPSVQAIRFRADGKGGEFASPFALAAQLDVAQLVSQMSTGDIIEAIFQSDDWLAFQMSDEWRDCVRRYQPEAGSILVSVPEQPAFCAKIDPICWRFNVLLRQPEAMLAARLDAGNPARLVKRALFLASRETGSNRSDRRLINELALLIDAFEGTRGDCLAAQMLRVAQIYCASAAEDKTVFNLLNDGWQVISHL